MQEQIIARLKSLSEPEYQKFNRGLIPGVDNILGVRSPYLRQIAREIAKYDWRSYLDEAENNDDIYMEQTLIHGIVIGLIKTDLTEILKHVSTFLPKINNWAVCDSFCCGLKIADKYQSEVWEFLQPIFSDNHEYYLRFGVVMMLSHYINENYIDRVLASLDLIHHDGYYLKMAVAWAVSVCYIKFPTRTLEFLQHNSLDDLTFNKALQKICESKRIDLQTKALIKDLKR